jgi:hypothetical protein
VQTREGKLCFSFHLNTNTPAFSPRPDFVALHLPPGAEVPSPVDARDALCMIEMKFDDVVKSQPPKLHDSRSGSAVQLTYGGTVTLQSSRWTDLEQIMDYDCLALTAQGPICNFMIGLLVTLMRLQIMCMISEERNFSDNFSLLFTILIGLYKSEAQRAGLQSAITLLSGPEGMPLQPSDFDASDRVVRTGAMRNVSRPIYAFSSGGQASFSFSPH